MQRSFPSLSYSRVNSTSRMSFNVGVAFFILCLFFSKSFSLTVTLSCPIQNSGMTSGHCNETYNLSSGYFYDSQTGTITTTITADYYSQCVRTYSVPPGSSVSLVSSQVYLSVIGSGYVAGRPEESCSVSQWGTAVNGSGFFTVCSSSLCISTSSGILSGIFSFNVNNDPPAPPPCDIPFPISAPQCNGGNGLFMRSDGLTLFNSLIGMFGNPSTSEDLGSVYYYTWGNGSPSAESFISPPGSENNPFSLRPDGSQCNNYNSGAGQRDVLICPLGHESPPDPPSSSSSEPSSSSSGGNDSSSSSDDGSYCDEHPESHFCECQRNPNLPQCETPPIPDLCNEFPTLPYCQCKQNPNLPWCSGAFPSSGSNTGQSSSGAYDLCTEFPHLIFCQSSDSGGGSSGGSNGGTSSASSGGTNDGGINFGGGNGGEGNATCLANNNCNWARIDVQLNQLGVETQTRDIVANIASLQSAGYNLTNEQNILLHSVLQAVNSGNADVVGAINGLASAVNSASSANNDNFNSQLSTWQDMMNKIFGNGDGSGEGNGEGEGSGTCTGDDCVPGGLGSGDTSGFSGKANKMISGGGKGFAPWTNSQIDALIPSKIASGQCPVIDKQLSFFGTKIPFHIDFNNFVKGSDFDWAKFMKACLLITVYFINTFSMIAIFRSGGHK